MKICKKTLKVTLFIFILYALSPIFVDFYWDKFSTYGWMAIGQYSNNYIDGFSRSIYFSIYFLPFIYISFYYLFKIKENNKLIIKKNSSFFYCLIFFSLILLYIVGYSFKLGITGVETPTELRLSGLLHYFRSYIVPIFIIIYLKSNKVSLTIIIIYSLIAGLTSSSRFAGLIPLLLFIIFSYINPYINIKRKRVIALFSILIIFILITLSRKWVFAEDIDNINIEFNPDLFLGIINQIFLRIGIGRDVILASEVLESGVCSEYFKFIWTGNSCLKPSLDFYGVDLEGNKFYLAAPTFASFFALNGNFLIQVLIYIIFLLQISFSGIIHIYLSKLGTFYFLLSIFSWTFSLIFIFIGPILFFNYLFIIILLFIVTKYLFNKICKVYL